MVTTVIDDALLVGRSTGVVGHEGLAVFPEIEIFQAPAGREVFRTPVALVTPSVSVGVSFPVQVAGF
ncbi:MAG TPA: hypothetical protein VIJ54_11145, partial [Actinomycetes bacterium]